MDSAHMNGTSAGPRALFHWADYLVFAISLGIPLVIGVFFMFYKREESTTETFLTGERSMNFVAVALSILASLLNGTFVIGVPAEVHYYGVAVSYMTIGILLALVISAHIFVPKYHAMMLTSAYEVRASGIYTCLDLWAGDTVCIGLGIVSVIVIRHLYSVT